MLVYNHNVCFINHVDSCKNQLRHHQPCFTLQWLRNGYDSVSNYQPHNCLLNHLFRGRSKKTSKLRVTGLCEGNSPGTGEFPAQMASNVENVSIWWHHHDIMVPVPLLQFVILNHLSMITVIIKLSAVHWGHFNLCSLIARFMGPIWGRQDPGGPHVGPMIFAIWVAF